MSGTAGAAAGSMQISMDLHEFSSALALLNSRIDRLRDVIGAIPPPEAPAGSPAITEFAKALDELISVAGSIGELLTTDAAAYRSAYNAKIAQDNTIARLMRGTH